MNKKNSIIVGLLAGSLFLSTNTAEASTTTGDSNTTSEAKTVVNYQVKSPYNIINQYNWRAYDNFKYVANAKSVANEIVAKYFVIDGKEEVAEKPVVTEKEPVAEKPVVTEKKPVAEKPAVTERKPVEKPVETEKQQVEKQEAPVKKPVAQTPSNTVKEPVVQKPATENKEEVKVSSEIQQVVDLTNQERAKQGLKALQIDTKLTQSAQAKSQDMKDKNYFSHTSPTYGSPFDQMKSFGVTYKAAGENIAMGQRSAKEVVDGWMNSQGHRENILNPSYTHIGVGLSDSGFYWTQQFIGK
ncbi:CAP domain-containing protein [Psychrobacillus sp. FJAT-51614]|uniref:CAP domain-containing protein n=1 Tax=Psychrobacillus mangrovi TaxID=3117745 RepID=A0ABU8EZN5_9BACI